MIMHDYYWFSLFVALNALLLLVLGVNISRLRITKKIAHGDGGDKEMMQAIRAHGNGVEHVPVFALSILALTFVGAASGLLATLVIGFTASRLVHAYGMTFREFTARQAGAGVTFLFQCIAIIALLINISF